MVRWQNVTKRIEWEENCLNKNEKMREKKNVIKADSLLHLKIYYGIEMKEKWNKINKMCKRMNRKSQHQFYASFFSSSKYTMTT